MEHRTLKLVIKTAFKKNIFYSSFFIIQYFSFHVSSEVYNNTHAFMQNDENVYKIFMCY